MYHSITLAPDRDPDQMTTPMALFARHLDVIRAHGHRVVPADAIAVVDGRAVAITFDDGLADLASLAAPLLASRGMPATAFVLGEPTLRGHKAHLTVDQLRDLDGRGIAIGYHGSTHRNLRTLADDELRADVDTSRGALEQRCGLRLQLFAYPFGSFDAIDDRVRRAVVAAGYTAAFTAIAGPSGGPDADLFALRRDRVSWAVSAAALARILDGAYDWYAWVQRIQAALNASARRV